MALIKIVLMKTDQLAYLRIWKWGLTSEILMIAVLGFSMSLWCGFATLAIWTTTNLFFYYEVFRPAKVKRLVTFALTFATLNSLGFVLSGVFAVILKRLSEGVHFEKAIQSVSGAWPQLFLIILLFAIFTKALTFAIATGVQKIISKRGNTNSI